jgi:2-polyprenyl-3-methyl-5-hydroxy-6-metoxy-1,4-benzoquinol methylase
LLEASEQMPKQDFVVRMLLINTHIPLNYVNAQVDYMIKEHVDLVTAPLDYNISLAADVITIDILERINKISDNSVQGRRALFNPFSYVDTHTDMYSVHYLEPAPVFTDVEKQYILQNKRLDLEFSFLGRNFSASWYNYIVESGIINDDMAVLDIACANGQGASLLSGQAKFVLGCDYQQVYIDMAKSLYPENEKLRYTQGDGTTFLYEGGDFFDVITCLHTLEHVENDQEMARNLVRNLKPGGLLIAEVPILAKRPCGFPLIPSHLREYSPEGFLALFSSSGLQLEKVINACRGHYAENGKLREAMRIHLRKRM